jgi:protein-S-isoprenylcysteine O-methyltransferase Ste14
MEQKTKTFSATLILQLVFVVILLPLLPLLISWRWDWWEAWVFAAIIFLGFVLSRVLAARKHPDIIAERAGSMKREDAKPWDKFLAPAMAFGGVVIPVVAGLEARFGWPPGPFSLPVKLAAIAVMVLAYVFASWAMIENANFSGIVRLQTDRGHSVCSSGPYRWVRHPAYASGFWSYLAMPLMLDSAWGLIPVAILFGVIIVRTRLEDRTLQEELPGYREYAARMKYRLFPGIW